MTEEAERHAGLAAALGAFCVWGLAPLYFKLIGHVGADEMVAHRIIWSMLFLVAVLALRERSALAACIRVSPRVLAALGVSAALSAVKRTALALFTLAGWRSYRQARIPIRRTT